MKDTGAVLLISHPETRCGVHQFGLAVAQALRGSRKFDFRYVECGCAEDYHRAVLRHAPLAIIYNHYPSTLPWLEPRVAQRHRLPHVGIMHEVTQAKANRADQRLFDFHIGPDPTLLLSNPIVFKTGRLVPRYDQTQAVDATPTIGSFGFGTAGKGFERLITAVQEEFDHAVIRLNIPFAAFGDSNGEKARAIGDTCRALITKPGITLDLKHDFLSVEQLLRFLAGNSLNAFLYEYQSNRGISSVVDYALAVKRPLAITKSSMFRHVYRTRPAITIEDSRLSSILDRGFAPLERYAEEWSEENLRWDYERIVEAVLRTRRVSVAGSVAGRTPSPARRVLSAVVRTAAQTAAPLLDQAELQLTASRYGEHIARSIQKLPVLAAGLRTLRAEISGRGCMPTDTTASADWIPRATEREIGLLAARRVEPYRPVATVGTLNRILDQSAFVTYGPAIEYLFCQMPELMARKIPAANIQQAFVLDTVLRLAPNERRPALLCVGSYEDTAAGAIAISGLGLDEVDPVINYDLSTFMTKPSCKRESYDVVFATSVIEHIADDEGFLKHFEELLAPGGYGVLTCDFNDNYRSGDPLPVEDRRLYTQRDLRERLMPLIGRCALVDDPNWQCDDPKFVYGGCRYTFASLVFRKLR